MILYATRWHVRMLQFAKIVTTSEMRSGGSNLATVRIADISFYLTDCLVVIISCFVGVRFKRALSNSGYVAEMIRSMKNYGRLLWTIVCCLITISSWFQSANCALTLAEQNALVDTHNNLRRGEGSSNMQLIVRILV